MEFKFPLPPVTTPSPASGLTKQIESNSPQANTTTSSEFDHSLDHPSSTSSLFNIFHTNPAVEVSPEPFSSDHPARVHPVFINSDLHPDHRVVCQSEEEYPVDRLSPICIGYFNHKEYEAAMASIYAAEEMLIQHQRNSELPTPTDVLGDSLQRRRSTSYTPASPCN